MKTKLAKPPSGGRKRAARRRSTKAALPAKLVRIGNSRGVRLPKAVIEQAGLTDAIELSVRDGEVVIRPVATARKARAGWEEKIRAVVAEHGDDIDDFRDLQSLQNEFDKKEWTW